MSLGGMHLGSQLKAAGIDPTTIKETNYQAIAEVGGARTQTDLMHLAQSMLKNPNISQSDKDSISGSLAAPGKDGQDLRTALLKIAANTDQESTSATAARDTAAATDRIATSLGDHVFETFNVMKDALMKQAFGGRQGYVDYESQQIDDDERTRADAIHLKYATRHRSQRHHGDASRTTMDPEEALELRQNKAEADSERKSLLMVTGHFTLSDKNGAKAAPDVTTKSTIGVPRAVH
jgi:hypothetical protein